VPQNKVRERFSPLEYTMGIANTENDPASGGQTGENDLRGDALDGA
jgi:hypothetical protein